MSERIEKSEAEWRAQLTPEQYHITREAGTERPYTGEYNDHYEAGAYHCICCDAPLFDGGTKFPTHCGWPGFFQARDEDCIEELEDHDHGMARTEVRCHRCGAHLGHVFNDGPPPTGLRYCINSAALSFKPAQ